MALMHQTTMSPTKLELLTRWLPGQPWFGADPQQLEIVGSYRLDDPAGEVGIECILLSAGDGATYHVPLSYRSAPFADSEPFMLGTSEHGVLGTRYIANAAGDPVAQAVIAETIARGGRQADEIVQDAEGNRTSREPRVRVQGTGRPSESTPDLQSSTVQEVGHLTRIENENAVLDLVRVIDHTIAARADQLALQGTWSSQAAPTTLALLYSA